MKNTILAIALGLCSLTAQAQVDNYALQLEGGNVNLGQHAELASLNTYTVQLWVNPQEWTPGASLMQCGNVALQMGNAEGSLVWTAGQGRADFAATGISAGEWHHITLAYDGIEVRLYVDNQPAGSQKNADLAMGDTSENNLVIGGNFTGRIDEFRIWNTVLPEDYERFWRNTLNEYCPSWSHLKVYHTFDQYLCPVIWDYTGQRHHGTLSTEGAMRAKVDDNPLFKYRINLAYADWSRFCDRMVDAEKYRLSNYVSMIGISTYDDGTAQLQFPLNEATPKGGARWMADYEGRQGIMALDSADGTLIDLGTGIIEPAKGSTETEGYTFMTWIYLDEWTEGAYIFRKERSETEGLSIRLGSVDTRQVIVRCNGHEYIRDKKLSVGRWTHLAVSTNIGTTNQGEVFLFSFDGVGSFPSRGNFPSALYSHALPSLPDVVATIGEGGLKAHLDETIIWNSAKQPTEIAAEMVTPKVPGPTMKCDALPMRKACAFWAYDRKDCPGYDTYSYRHFFNVIRECYGDCQGYRLLICASGHTGWESTFANATKRERLAKDLAAIANLPDFDGLDLDFEWTYSTAGWNNYALLCKTIRENLAEGKTLSASPHQVAFGYPVDKMQYVDFFNFQVYGPGQTYLFTRDGYTSALRQFENHGYPKEKIVMSYGTTTSGGCDENGNVIRKNNAITYAPVGYRNFFPTTGSGETLLPSDDRAQFGNNYYYFTGYDQTVWRAQQCHDEQLGGIMYWDMGNDIATSDPMSLARGASLALNSNVVPLYTSADGDVLPPVGIAAPTVETPAATSASQRATTYLLDGRVATKDATGIVITNGKKQIKR